MPLKVTVALVGSRDEPFTRISEEEWNRPWSDRPKVELDVEPEEMVASVIDRGLAELGIQFPEGSRSGFGHVNVAPYLPESSRGFEGPADLLTLIDDEGRAVWGVWDYRVLPYVELIRAAEANVLLGDPLRLHLVLREPIGDGAGVDWAAVLHAWEVAKQLMEGITLVGATVVVLHKIRQRLTRGKQVAERDAHRWVARGATWPKHFADFLDDRAWSSARVAELVGVSQDEAEAILGLFGFSEGPDGLWHLGADEEGRVLRLIFDEALWGDVARFEAAEARFRERVEALLETGELPPRVEHDEEWPELAADEDYCTFCGQVRPKSYLIHGSEFASICGDCIAISVVRLVESVRGTPFVPPEARGPDPSRSDGPGNG